MLLMASLQQLLLPSTTCLAIKKKYKAYQSKKTQFEDTEQTSEPDISETVEFKATMINILKTLMDKAGSIQEQAGNVSREMKILRTTKHQR